MEYLPLPIAALVAYYKITDIRRPPRHRSAQGVRRFTLGRRIRL